jgi:hypothetical protein
VNFTNAMPDANYVCLPIGYSPAGTFPYIPVFSSQTASAIRFVNHAATIGNFDPANVHLAVFR